MTQLRPIPASPPLDDPLADARTVVLGGCDTNGTFRAKRLPADRFAGGAAPAVSFSDGIWAMDLHDALQPPPSGFAHWFPSWERGYGDVVAVPDLDTLRPLPWLDRTALVLCDYRFPNGEPVRVAPRVVLRRVLERFAAFDVTPKLATEFEFTLLREDERSVEAKGYRDLEPLSPHAQGYGATRASADGDFVGRLREALEALGIAPEAWAPEGGPGQYELNVPPAEALRAADEGFLFKQAVKELALQHGLIASFMPKQATLGYGNGLHVHQSLLDRSGAPCSHDASAPDGISTAFRRFVGGQLATMRDFALLLLPTVNDYKRIVPHSGTGTTATWGVDNKTVSLRLLPHGASACRVESRVAGAGANVYLVLAALLAGGAHGLEQEVEPPPLHEGNAYVDPAAPPLPRSLEEAIGAFEQSEVTNATLGEDFVAYYAATRRWEAEQYAAAVTDWELRRYLLRG